MIFEHDLEREMPVYPLALLFLAVRDVAPPEPPLAADAIHYITLFSYQLPRPFTTEAHTFATVIRMNRDGTFETHTISWLPVTSVARPLRLRPEPGRNFSLEETAQLAMKSGSRISMWGPFLIRPGLYGGFVRHKADLDSGAYLYRAIDSVSRKSHKVNCIHAITDIDRVYGRVRYPLFRYGDRATRYIADQLRDRGALPEGRMTHDEVIPALGLDAYPVTRQDLPADRAYPVADLRHWIGRGN